MSVNNLELKKGDLYQLYTTISPSTANQTVVYSSVNPNCATVNDQGEITAIDKGNTVIRAETINGLIAVCNVEVYIATGEVLGCITYTKSLLATTKFADSGATVQLIPTDIEAFPNEYYPSSYGDYEDYGIYTTQTDLSGNYKFSNIPIGEYQLIVISVNAKWDITTEYEYYQDIDSRIDQIYGEYIGTFVKKSSKKEMFTYLLAGRMVYSPTITVKENNETNISYTMVNLR